MAAQMGVARVNLNEAGSSPSPAAPPRRKRALRAFLRTKVAVAGVTVAIVMTLVALLAPILATHPADVGPRTHPEIRLLPPSGAHWFGTDELGRDLYSRVLFGIRASMIIAVATVSVTFAIGVPVGVTAGFSSDWWPEVLMRLADVFLSIPSIVLAILFATLIGKGMLNLVIAIALVWWPVYARLAHGITLTTSQYEYVTAARALGARPARIMARHVLPNILSPLLIQVSLDFGRVILFAAGLAFIGLGPPVPVPELGTMVESSRRYALQAWWTAVFPGAAIFFLALAFNILGDSLRDAFDPRVERNG
ncbi:MAG TPA: ABC transporter permease [bacterium]|jgi:peptide/nickel transport system permease protein